MKQTAIIILNYLTWSDTIKEIQQIRCYFDSADYEIILVDNCSPNESADRLRTYAVENKYIFLESCENRGYAAGNNIGLKYAYEKGYKYALVINNDIVLSSDILTSLCQNIQKADDIAAVSPKILSPTGYEFNRDSKYPTFFDLTIGMISYKKRGRVLKDEGGWAYVYRPQGCCMLVDMKAMNEIGYFDERTFLYCEEIILAERFLSKGYRVATLVEEAVVHNHSKTVRSVFNKQKYIKMNLNSYGLYLKEYRHFSWIKRQLCELFMALKLMILE